MVFAHLIAYKTPTADFGIVLAYDRLILGEIRTIELDSFFEPIWSVGGIYKVACEFVFDSGLNISRATVQIPMFLEPSDGILPPREQAAWSAIWRGVRGKRPEW